MKGQFPWIGRSRGSAGGMTTCKINDKNVMRAKAFEVANPKTAAQVMQRDFFKQMQEVCASVTEDQLRSLFGVKPKAMTRRNALSKQVSEAYSIDGTSKTLDFSKLLAIGNGDKVSTPIFHFEDGGLTETTVLTSEMLPGIRWGETNIIGVFFVQETNSIVVVNSNEVYDPENPELDYVPLSLVNYSGYGYYTMSSDGQNVSLRSFGTFTIKTRTTD